MEGLTPEHIRILCSVFTALSAAALRVSSSKARRGIWALLIALSLGGALSLNTQVERMPGGTLIHQYLGSRYAIDYADYSEALSAAQQRIPSSEPHPLRERLFYLERLSEAGTPHATLKKPTDELARLCQQQGLTKKYHQDVLVRILPDEKSRENFVQDVQGIASQPQRAIQLNESPQLDRTPFSFALRKFDPLNYRSFGLLHPLAHMATQLLGIFLTVALLGCDLKWSTDQHLFALALLVGSFGFSNEVMNGPSIAAHMLPFALLLYGIRRPNTLLAGIGLCSALLINPLTALLLIPFACFVIRGTAHQLQSESEGRSSANAISPLRRCVSILIVAFGISIALFFLSEQISGRTWVDYFAFTRSTDFVPAPTGSGIGLFFEQVKFADLHSLTLVKALLLAAGCLLIWKPLYQKSWAAFPALLILWLCLTGWSDSGISFYGLFPLCLLPGLLTKKAKAAMIWGFLFAAAYAVPLLSGNNNSPMALFPVLALPFWCLVRELKASNEEDLSDIEIDHWTPNRLGPPLKILGMIMVAIVFLEMAAQFTGKRHWLAGRKFLADGNTEAAREELKKANRYLWGNSLLHVHRSVALQETANWEATTQLQKAIALDDQQSETWAMLGRLHLQAGRTGLAEDAMERARTLAPYEVAVGADLASILAIRKNYPAALKMAERAVQLDPARYEAEKLRRNIIAASRSPSTQAP